MKSILIHPKDVALSFQNRMFESNEGGRGYGFYGHYWMLALKRELKQRGYELNTIDLGDVREAEKIVFISMHNDKYFKECVKQNLNDKMILFEVEFPINSVPTEGGYPTGEYRSYFDKVFTWNEEIIDNVKIFRMCRPNNWYRGKIERITFKQRKFLIMTNTNKHSDLPNELYSERRKAVLFFQRVIPEQFDLYGNNWSRSIIRYVRRRLGLNVDGKESNKGSWIARKLIGESDYSKCLRGWTDDVYQIYSQYRFCVCYECASFVGAISNKIFDCFQVGCVPIYLGATDVEKHISMNTFIDKRKYNYPELLEYLLSIEKTEFEEYLHNIKGFLKNKEGLRHFEDGWAREFCKELLN